MPDRAPTPDEAARLGASLSAASTTAHPAPAALYIHIPFCAVRCGYCDFNTYVADFGPGASRTTIAATLAREVTQARTVLGPRLIGSIFFGGGTPTQLPAPDLAAILAHIRSQFELAPGLEVTTEANPDTVTPQLVTTLAAAGFTRVSLGMQSARPSVLATLDRTHNPAQVPRAVDLIRAAGMDVSLDLIYGTPGETLAEWEASLAAAISYGPDHISAYSLVIEPGTKMGAQLARGQITPPDSDLVAQMYATADATLAAAGYHWYEISNFARIADPTAPLPAWDHASRHNLAYWHDWDWWGIGPGAHSHVGDLRAWNSKHPGQWAQAVTAGGGRVIAGLPGVADYEQLTASQRLLERVMLALRTRTGLQVAEAGAGTGPAQAYPAPTGLRRWEAPPQVVATELCPEPEIAQLIAEGLVAPQPWEAERRLVLTLRGRLLADLVTRRLLPD